MIPSIIIKSIEGLNSSWGLEYFQELNADTRLFHPDSPMTSMQLVQLVARLEEVVEEETGQVITLADEHAMSQKRSPFLTIGSLSEYITSLLTP